MLIQKLPVDATNKEVLLITYILDDSKSLLSGKKRPAVLIYSGGAYLNCSDREAEPVDLRFAAMGYYAFALRYHVFFDTPDGFERLLKGEQFKARKDCQYPAAIRDIAHVMTMQTNGLLMWKKLRFVAFQQVAIMF